MAEDMKTENTVKKKSFWSENKVEVIVAILLGATAILTAWATWIGSLHGGNQATNYTKSNNLAAEGNSDYNAGLQLYLSDIMTWNTMMEYTFDLSVAETENNPAKVALLEQKLDTYADQNASDILIEGLQWMDENDAASPFDMPGITDQYFETAKEKLEQSQKLLEEGQSDNSKGDAYNLVTVIFSLILFLLGIVGIFKRLPNRAVVLIIAAVGLVLTTVYMLTIPMPTGFHLLSFIGL